MNHTEAHSSYIANYISSKWWFGIIKIYIYKNYRKRLLNIHLFMKVSAAPERLPNIKSSAIVDKGYEKRNKRSSALHWHTGTFFLRSPVRPETTGQDIWLITSNCSIFEEVFVFSTFCCLDYSNYFSYNISWCSG